MVGLRVFGVGVIVIVVMMVPVPVPMIVIMVVMVMIHIQPASACAEIIAKLAGFHGRAGGVCSLAFHMVVVAFLYSTHFAFKAQHLHAILAQHTGRRRPGAKGWVGALLD